MGAPRKYKPEYCQKVIDFGKDGLSIAEMACEIGVAKQTLYSWMKFYPEFLDAMNESVSNAQAWYEKKARHNVEGGKLNTPLWTKIVSSRFREDYTETIINKNFESGKEEEVIPSQIEATVAAMIEDCENKY